MTPSTERPSPSRLSESLWYKMSRGVTSRGTFSNMWKIIGRIFTYQIRRINLAQLYGSPTLTEQETELLWKYAHKKFRKEKETSEHRWGAPYVKTGDDGNIPGRGDLTLTSQQRKGRRMSYWRRAASLTRRGCMRAVRVSWSVFTSPQAS